MRLHFARAVVAVTVYYGYGVNSAVVDLPIHVRNTYSTVEVQIGTPPSTYLLLFDTGSSSAWVDDESCAMFTCPNGSGYERVGYNASASSTSLYLGSYGEIEYYGGAIGGSAVADMFKFDSADGASLCWDQTFLATNESSWRFIYADGFLGMSFSSIAAPNTTTVVETLLQQGLLDEPRFGIHYGTELTNTGDNPDGILTIGGSKEDIYVNGTVTYISLRPEDEFEVWQVTMQSIAGSRSSVGIPTTTTLSVENGLAVFDTGSGSIQVPTELIDELYESIGFNYSAILRGDHIPQCTEFNSSWSVSFTFGESEEDSTTVSISGDELVRPGFANSDLACFPPFEDSNYDGFALIGTPYLQQRYSIWDFGSDDLDEYEPRVGFGILKDVYKP